MLDTKLDLEAKTIHYLEMWGKWQHNSEGGRGYPNQTTFRRLQSQGVVSTPNIDEDLGLLIDEWISDLINVGPDYKEVAKLAWHYGISCDDMRKYNSRLTPSRARIYRRFVISWIASRLCNTV